MNTKGKTLKVNTRKPQRKINNKANIRINKCWNTIRFIAEHDHFTGSFLNIIEDNLRPLFEYISEPTQIDFDDDILFCISALIRKAKSVSPTCLIVFKYLP